MASGVSVTILGTAQDGGIPQAGCSCERCNEAHKDLKLRKYPVSLGIIGTDGSKHIIEVTKNLSEQLMIWSTNGNELFIPETVSITHLHLGHVEGIGQFGKPVMASKEVDVFLSHKNKNIFDERSDIKLMIEENNIRTHAKNFNQLFEPMQGCGFSLQFISIPHRSELGDTAAIIIKGNKRNILFMPDQDSWKETLEYYSKENIREFLKMFDINEALIDGTFWSMEELPGRNISEIPHPTIQDSLKLLGKRMENDPRISFLHLNHSNPVNDIGSKQRKLVEENGWRVSEIGDVLKL
ncbi:MAG: MBL fold metallo-hydrolase [Candidatus Thalassarchaeaceae archaeon]|nr:MBL fold metallo-hydrolase [Candidatus Thalassarchaeaceae archaeon]